MTGTRPATPRRAPSPGPRPRPRGRPSPAVLRRRRLGALGLVLGILGLALGLGLSTGGGGRGSPVRTPGAARGSTLASSAPATIRTTLASWRLPTPLSRAGLVTLPNGTLLLVGGLDGQGGSTAALRQVDPASGTVRTVGQLAQATHDAATALVGHEVLVLGGGQVTSTALVQGVPLSGSAPGGPAALLGELPTARSDSEAVVVGGQALVAGGWDGTSGTGAVLATTDGTSFRTLAQLPQPVRYPALAVLGHTLWVLGGLAASNGASGQPVATIQRVDLATGQASLAGDLPEPLTGAAAVDLAGHLLLVGGRTATGDSTAVFGLVPQGGSATDPRTLLARPVGQLAQGVAHAAVGVVGHTAWVLGGETAGTPVATVQALRLTAS